MQIVPRVFGQIALTGAIGVRDIYLEVAIPIAGEEEVPAVRRPLGFDVTSSMIGESNLAGAVGIHDVDLVVAIPIAGESNFAAVG
jgi:hypothetical protein